MRAAVLNGFGLPAAFELQDLDGALPGDGEAAVAVEYAAVNFPDVMVIEGTYQALPELPFVPGTEFVGRVTHVGPSVSDLEVGQRVVGRQAGGVYQEVIIARAAILVTVPESVDPKDAASVPLSALTAHHALRHRARLAPDDVVLVTGATGVLGATAVQVAAALGCRVFASARSPESVPDVVRAVADQIVPATPYELRASLRNLTGGSGVDVVVETVGDPVFAAALRSMAWEGRMAVVGFAGGTIPAPKAGLVLVKNIEVSGMQITDYWKRKPDQARAGVAELLDLMASGQLKMRAPTVFSLDHVGEAIDAVRSRTAYRALLQLGEEG